MSTTESDFSSEQNKQLLQQINKNQIQIADNLTAWLDVETPSPGLDTKVREDLPCGRVTLKMHLPG